MGGHLGDDLVLDQHQLAINYNFVDWFISHFLFFGIIWSQVIYQISMGTVSVVLLSHKTAQCSTYQKWISNEIEIRILSFDTVGKCYGSIRILLGVQLNLIFVLEAYFEWNFCLFLRQYLSEKSAKFEAKSSENKNFWMINVKFHG